MPSALGGSQLVRSGGGKRGDGEFVALDRPERVCFTWRTDAGDPKSIVTVLLAAHGEDQTHMTIIHSRLQATLVPNYLGGWSSVASRLSDHLAA